MFGSLGSTQSIHESNSTNFYERRVVVRSGSVEIVTLSGLKGTLISRCWIPDSIVSLNWHRRAVLFDQEKEYGVLKSIVFESNSRLARIESETFSNSSLRSISIPKNVEILGSACFYICISLLSITFESNSCLTRIESGAFYGSSLQSIVIPQNVRFIDGSAFLALTLSSISIESGNEMFVIENGILIDVLHHTLIRNFSESSEIEIGRNIEILGSNCFSYCKSLSLITFESNSHLTRIESGAFSSSSLQSILIPRNVEILGSKCFLFCNSLSSITFESNSHLTRIESMACSFSSLQSILIPSNVEILGSLCFSNCKSLSSVTFESNSHLTRIESGAFYGSSLPSILIPSRILFIAYDAVQTAGGCLWICIDSS
jgi:hypothetical protein